MMKKLRKISALLLCLSFLIMISSASFTLAAGTNDRSAADQGGGGMSVKITYGEGKNQLGAAVEVFEREGPKSFFLNNDCFYVLDSVKKRIAVFDSKGYKNELSIDFCKYPLDMVFDGKDIFIYDDPDQPKVYQINLKGELVNSIDISIPTLDNTKDSLQGLRLGINNAVMIYDSAYNEYEINPSGKSVSKGSAGITNKYSNQRFIGKKDKDGRRHISSTDLTTDILVNSEGRPFGASILGYESDGSIYVLVIEMSDTSKVAAEYTIRKYDKRGGLAGIARIPIEDYFYTPFKMIDVAPEGVYIMITGKDNAEIKQVTFASDFISSIAEKENSLRKLEAADSNQKSAALTTFNSRQTTNDRAWAIDNCYWYYAQYNYQPIPTGASRPDWLTSYNVNLYGIPYCWGGFDAMDRHSVTSWSNFIDSMNKQAFAGNVTCSGGYKTGTSGLDCSGYCGACLGYTTKPGTYDLYGDSHSVSVSNRGLCDIYIEPSSHVLFFISEKTDGTGIISAEATIAGDDKCKIYSRTYSWLSSGGYSLRSFW